MTPEKPRTIELPEPPRLVLRVGFAGNCDLPEGAKATLEKALELVFETIARQLIEIAPESLTIPSGRRGSRGFSLMRNL